MPECVPAEAIHSGQAVAAKLARAGDAPVSGLAQARERYGTLEATRERWEKAVADLRAEHGRLRAEVAALRSRRDHLTAGIEAVRDEGLVARPSSSDRGNGARPEHVCAGRGVQTGVAWAHG